MTRQVGQALRAAELGVDVVIAQGSEAGGQGMTLGTTLFMEAKRLNLEGIPSPDKKYRGRPRRYGTTWTPMAISRIVGRRAYSGTHVIHASTGEIEREVPLIVPAEVQETAIARLSDNKRYSGGRRVRKYLLRGLIKCAKCGWRYSGVARKQNGRYHFKYTCPHASSRRFDPHSQAGEFEEKLASLTKRLASARGEKDKVVKLYAAGHLDEEELETHLMDLKNRISNLKMLIESAEAGLVKEEQDATAANSTAMWLTSLRGNLEALEVDTDEAWYGRHELVEQLVERITVSRTEDGRAKVHIAYKFAPPVQAASGTTNLKRFEILAGDTPIREAPEEI